MRRIYTFSLEEDRKLALRLQAAALLMIIPFSCLFYAPVSGEFSSPAAVFLTPVGLPFRILDWAVVAAAVICILLLHELIHGALFKVFAPKHSRIAFGFSSGFAYAAAPEVLYPKIKYLVIGLGPFAVLTLAALLLIPLLPKQAASPLFTAAVWNGAGSAGDLYISYTVLKLPPGTQIKDRGTEFSAYQ